MKKIIFFCPLICCIAVSSFSEIAISAGPSASLSIAPEVVFLPEITSAAAISGYHVCTDIVSMFFDSTGEIGYFPLTNRVDGEISLSGDLSFRTNRFLAMLKASSLLWLSTSAALPDMDTSLEAFLSLDDFSVSYYVSPKLVASFGIEQSLWIQGEAGMTAMVSDELVLKAAFGAGILIPQFTTGYFLKPFLDISWYPGPLATVMFDIGVQRNVSSLTEVLVSGMDAVFTETYWKPFLAIESSILIDPVSRISIKLPVDCILKEHNAVFEGSYVDAPEWSVGFYPSFALTFDITETFSLVGKMTFTSILSNSDYLRALWAEFGINVEFHIE